MLQNPKPYEIYRHFKGNLYQIINIAEHSETGEQLVIYQALYGDYKLYARPLTMFLEKVDKVKYPDAKQEYRFERQTEIQAAACQQAAVAEPKIEPEQAAVAEVKTVQEQAEADGGTEFIDPAVLAFLEADEYGEKLNILAELHHRVTDDMITTMAVASDVEVPDGELEDRYESLKSCLLTRERYECSRLRQ